MQISEINGLKTQRANVATPSQTKTTPTEKAKQEEPKSTAVVDQTEVSPEAQQASGSQAASGNSSVQNLVEQLRSEVESIKSGGAEADSKTSLNDTYQKVSSSGQLAQVDSQTRTDAENILGISSQGSGRQTQGGTGSTQGSGQPTYSSGVENSLNNLLGNRKSA